jgi:hypothetical protein
MCFAKKSKGFINYSMGKLEQFMAGKESDFDQQKGVVFNNKEG